VQIQAAEIYVENIFARPTFCLPFRRVKRVMQSVLDSFTIAVNQKQFNLLTYGQNHHVL
jgi:hypothetical protein